MAEPNPASKFSSLSASPVQKIDLNNGPALARALLQSEAYAGAYNTMVEVIPLSEPLIALTRSDNAAPPLNVPLTGTPSEITSNMMQQLQARLDGAGERSLNWGHVPGGNEAGQLKLKRGDSSPAAFPAHMEAVERLRVALRNNVVNPLLGPDRIDIFTAATVAGSETQVKQAFTHTFTEAVQAYQADLMAIGRAHGFGPVPVAEYTAPRQPEGNAMVNIAAGRISNVYVELANNLPVQAPTAGSVRPAVRRFE